MYVRHKTFWCLSYICAKTPKVRHRESCSYINVIYINLKVLSAFQNHHILRRYSIYEGLNMSDIMKSIDRPMSRYIHSRYNAEWMTHWPASKACMLSCILIRKNLHWDLYEQHWLTISKPHLQQRTPCNMHYLGKLCPVTLLLDRMKRDSRSFSLQTNAEI